MGGFSGGNPLLQVGASAIDAYTGIPVASAVLAASKAKESQRAQQEQNALQADAMQRQLNQQVRQRQDLLGRAMATQRARLAAMGVAAGGGSADALAAGLTREAAQDVADLQDGYADRKNRLDWQSRSSADVWSSALAPVASNLLSSRQSARDDDGTVFI